MKIETNDHIKSVLWCFWGEFIRNTTKNFENQEKSAQKRKILL